MTILSPGLSQPRSVEPPVWPTVDQEHLWECWIWTSWLSTVWIAPPQKWELNKLLLGVGGKWWWKDTWLWVVNTQYHIELYTWHLYNFISQCHPSKFNKQKKYIVAILSHKALMLLFIYQQLTDTLSILFSTEDCCFLCFRRFNMGIRPGRSLLFVSSDNFP